MKRKNIELMQDLVDSLEISTRELGLLVDGFNGKLNIVGEKYSMNSNEIYRGIVKHKEIAVCLYGIIKKELKRANQSEALDNHLSITDSDFKNIMEEIDTIEASYHAAISGSVKMGNPLHS